MLSPFRFSSGAGFIFNDNEDALGQGSHLSESDSKLGETLTRSQVMDIQTVSKMAGHTSIIVTAK